MPEHIHLLLTEPEVGTPSTVMQVLKQRTARALLPKPKRRSPRQHNLFGDAPKRRAFWQARSYDFNVWTTKKRVEKLRYMHRNPVKRGLVGAPEEWRWSSYRFYLLDEAGPVRVNEGWTKISFRNRTCANISGYPIKIVSAASQPVLAKNPRTGHPLCR
jgi:putative transposase